MLRSGLGSIFLRRRRDSGLWFLLLVLLRWHPRFAFGLLALPLCGATHEAPLRNRGCQRSQKKGHPKERPSAEQKNKKLTSR
jgi:hypothetical protein